jgi:succinoglycan biosynthesis protein ExoA
MRAAGGRIWMCGAATITYFPRATLRGLARQYANHGQGRARTLLTHRLRPKLRQMAPVAFLAGSVSGFALLPISIWFATLPLGYAALCTILGVSSALRARDPALLAMAPVAVVMHMSWAAGVLRTLSSWRRPAPTTRGFAASVETAS